MMPLLPLLAALACDPAPPARPAVTPADRSALAAALRFPLPLDTLHRTDGPPQTHDQVTVTPLRLDLVPGLSVGAALWTPSSPSGAGIVLGHGHFGQGKSAPETQELAWRLAMRGATVIAIDTPGTEEQDRPDNHLHMDGPGTHGRGVLLAAGTNAMALQVALLDVGLDLLAKEGATRFGAAGASGGGVQALYLAILDPRVQAVALAAFPPVPREARASGCVCDQVPGFPGPNPGVLALLDTPSLWMGDGGTVRAPPGLGSAAEFRHYDAPHTFSVEMQRDAVAFFASELDLPTGPDPDRVPTPDLAAPTPPADAQGLLSIALPAPPLWVPAPVDGVPVEVACEGKGPTVLVVGGADADQTAILSSGLRACRVRVVEDAGGPSVAIAQGTVYADVIAGGLAAAMGATAKRATAKGGAESGHAVKGIYAVGAWALPASTLSLPMVVRAPLTSPLDLDLEATPGWVHTPGVWHGGMQQALDRASHQGDDPGTLAAGLADELVD
jgi:dienelactone hydrolase